MQNYNLFTIEMFRNQREPTDKYLKYLIFIICIKYYVNYLKLHNLNNNVIYIFMTIPYGVLSLLH